MTTKSPSARKARLDEFLRSPTGTQASVDLLRGAFTLLSCSLREGEQTYRVEGNHFSQYATASIALFINAFDAWQNECLSYAVFAQKRKPKFKQLADSTGQSMWVKHKGLCRLARIKAVSAKKDIGVLTFFRNEIVHYYPRELRSSKYYQILKREKLVFNENVVLDHGFNNYRAAFWVASKLEQITAELGRALVLLKSEHSIPIFDTSPNFRIPEQIIHPDVLSNVVPNIRPAE